MAIKKCPLCHKRYIEYDSEKYPPCDECKDKYPRVYGRNRESK